MGLVLLMQDYLMLLVAYSLFYYTILKINNEGNFPKKLNNFLGQSEIEAEAILVKLHKT